MPLQEKDLAVQEMRRITDELVEEFEEELRCKSPGRFQAAEKNGIREADLQYEVPEVRSPYLEVSFCDLNTQTVEQTAVEVNPFYRFFDIFSGVLDINQKEYEKTKEIFVDAVFHYLALTDLRMGMSRKDYYFKFLVEELESGQFGRKAKAAIQLFSSYEKKIYCIGAHGCRIFS